MRHISLEWEDGAGVEGASQPARMTNNTITPSTTRSQQCDKAMGSLKLVGMSSVPCESTEVRHLHGPLHTSYTERAWRVHGARRHNVATSRMLHPVTGVDFLEGMHFMNVRVVLCCRCLSLLLVATKLNGSREFFQSYASR